MNKIGVAVSVVVVESTMGAGTPYKAGRNTLMFQVLKTSERWEEKVLLSSFEISARKELSRLMFCE